jgi:hypothetical protein
MLSFPGEIGVTFQFRVRLADDLRELNRALEVVEERPPANLELLLHLAMSPADCEALIGDLEERYRKLATRLGRKRADIWYAKQVLTSIWPLLRDMIRRLGSSAVVHALCLILRLSGLGSIAGDLQRISAVKRKRK